MQSVMANKFFVLSFFMTLCIIFYTYYMFSTSSPEDDLLGDATIQNYCDNHSRDLQIILRGKYWILRNYVRSKISFKCEQSITLTTTADYTFLENVVSAVENWEGPVSVGVYAPGDDFDNTLKSIAYLRNCESELVRSYVTFHLIIDSDHLPSKEESQPLLTAYKDFYDCSLLAPYNMANSNTTYKNINQLLFPINVVRNVAIEASQTHYVLPLDLNLYPSKNFTAKFLQMINNDIKLLDRKVVFVLPHFEIREQISIPSTKAMLKSMLQNHTATLHNKNSCLQCNTILSLDEWLDLEESEDLGIFKFTKWTKSWDPFFVRTRTDPLFDERFTWEGRGDKMAQSYTLCLLDYDYAILDNAFLIHKAGSKWVNEQKEDDLKKTLEFEKSVFKPETDVLYGRKGSCGL